MVSTYIKFPRDIFTTESFYVLGLDSEKVGKKAEKPAFQKWQVVNRPSSDNNLIFNPKRCNNTKGGKD